MADIESLSDDYVASLLAQDAKDSSIKYSALGVEAFMPSKVAANKPKPNTRFLRNIIQETDNHNAALLAKEAAEAKARLKSLEKKDVRSGADIRRRQLGHITAHLAGQPTKRRHGEDGESEHAKSRRKEFSSRKNNSGSDLETSHLKGTEGNHREHKTTRRDREDSSHHRSHKRYRPSSEERSSRNHDLKISSSRARSSSPERHRSKKSKHSNHSSNRRSIKLSSRREDEDRERRRYHRSRRHQISTSSEEDEAQRKAESANKKPPATAQTENQDEDSDPLEAIIGPLPPRPTKVFSRGRGTVSSSSGIDFRFSSNYDPTADVALDPGEENDWDQALEALRDRQKWNEKGAERLRAAGYTDEQVEKWERSGDMKGEKSVGDVKWAKKGETKEWDRGKVFSADSDEELLKDVDINYGRLKGT